LKFQIPSYRVVQKVAPHVGAWIEIPLTHYSTPAGKNYISYVCVNEGQFQPPPPPHKFDFHGESCIMNIGSEVGRLPPQPSSDADLEHGVRNPNR